MGKTIGFKNHYYISPSVWAWRESRVKQIKKNIESLYIILPFEKEYFEKKHQFQFTMLVILCWINYQFSKKMKPFSKHI